MRRALGAPHEKAGCGAGVVIGGGTAMEDPYARRHVEQIHGGCMQMATGKGALCTRAVGACVDGCSCQY